ncbi:hypothetical protein [Microbacterium sp. bgisy189]|uniref:hypothetical protein n=1 Tax=Microbacterium sp. bgisy189 TaxID=3413798 RepID=UPI003EB7A309
MPDFARFLPLSQRSDDDESGLTTDRRALIAQVVAAARVLPAGDREAVAAAAGRGRTTAELLRAMTILLRASDAAGVPVSLSDAALGTTAMLASARLPFDRRAVVSGHTIRASDTDWTLGRGPALEAPAIQIVRFLLGVSDVAPVPATDEASGQRAKQAADEHVRADGADDHPDRDPRG